MKVLLMILILGVALADARYRKHNKRRDPIDCTKFYSWKAGKKVEFSCAPNLNFNPNKQTCETGFPDGYNCIENSNYTARGLIETVGGLDIYRVGSGRRSVIFDYGIRGFDGGRTRQLVDLIAEMGYHVFMPDYFRGSLYNSDTQGRGGHDAFIHNYTQWATLKRDIDSKVLPYARQHGARSFFTVSDGWGSYLNMRLGSYSRKFRAGVSVGPVHPSICSLLGVNETQMLEEIRAPQLFLLGSSNQDNVMPGGLDQEVLGDKLSIVQLNDASHGYFTRGDITDPDVCRNVKKTLRIIVDFLKNNY